MHKTKYLLLSLIFLNINISAMEQLSRYVDSDSKITSNVKFLARFFITEINNSDTYKMILHNLRTERDRLVSLDNKLKLAHFFENFSNVLLDYFNEKNPACFSVANITCPSNFEEFFRRINDVCNGEQEQLTQQFQGSAILDEINSISSRLVACESTRINEEFDKFITKSNLLSTVKYSLHDERVRFIIFKNLLRFRLTSLKKIQKCMPKINSSSPLFGYEDKIISAFYQVNSNLIEVNFLAE